MCRHVLIASDSSELGVTIALDCEIILRFISDWRHFHKGKRNLVDLGLAVITTIIQIPIIKNSGQPYAWLTFFQIVRIYRVVLAVEMTRTLIVRNARSLDILLADHLHSLLSWVTSLDLPI